MPMILPNSKNGQRGTRWFPIELTANQRKLVQRPSVEEQTTTTNAVRRQVRFRRRRWSSLRLGYEFAHDARNRFTSVPTIVERVACPCPVSETSVRLHC